MNREHGGVENIDTLRTDFSRATSSQSRETVFPFLWKTFAHQGQIFGNQEKESIARVANQYAFSYSGYNEMIARFPDPHVDKNDFGPDPNVTVFEWLNRMPELQGRVAVFGTWDVFKDILQPEAQWLVHQHHGIYVADVRTHDRKFPPRRLPARLALIWRST